MLSRAFWVDEAEARWRSEIEAILAPVDFSKGRPAIRE